MYFSCLLDRECINEPRPFLIANFVFTYLNNDFLTRIYKEFY